MSIVKRQETAVGKPIDIVEPKRPLRRELNGGHDVVSVTQPMPDSRLEKLSRASGQQSTWPRP